MLSLEHRGTDLRTAFNKQETNPPLRLETHPRRNFRLVTGTY